MRSESIVGPTVRQESRGGQAPPGEFRETPFVPPADVYQTEDGYVVRMALPGVSRDQVNIDFHNERLLVTGTRVPASIEGAELTRAESPSGPFVRRFGFTLPVEERHVSARLDNGVLEIILPFKGAPEHARPVPVESDAERLKKKEDQVVELQKQAEDLSAESRGWREDYLRAVADLDNYRKRAERERTLAVERATDRLLEAVLPVLDNLERAISSNASGDDPQAVRQGMELILKQFREALTKEGVVRVEAVGRPFDPALHEAVTAVESAEEEGTVLAEELRGYARNGRVLRPSRVIVAKRRKEVPVAEADPAKPAG